MLLKGSTSWNKKEWKSDSDAQLINKLYYSWKSQKVIAKRIVDCNSQMATISKGFCRRAEKELPSTYSRQVEGCQPTTLPPLMLFPGTSSHLTSHPGFIPYPVYSTVSSGILIPLQINYTFSFITECSTMLPPSMQNSHVNSGLFLPVGDYLHPSFVHLLYEDFNPRCPLCKVCFYVLFTSSIFVCTLNLCFYRSVFHF